MFKGKTYLGIELGSTRIKSCLIDENGAVVATGSHEWENSFKDGYWTYSIEEVKNGVRSSFENLRENFFKKYGEKLTRVEAMGVSGMMHGYIVLDKDNNLLTPFRTWRNTTTLEAASELTELFNFNIPQRWSIAHLYQAILNNEEHIKDIAHMTTVAGYVHFLLTGKYEAGIGEASGIFPVKNNDYDSEMLDKFSKLVPFIDLKGIMPCVKNAGEGGSFLTKEGALFLCPDGSFECDIPVCPPEGDAGTGMVATNSVTEKTGNISAGTSIFSMLVLDRHLEKAYPEIDIVTTPDGSPVAMVHCNNCSSELDAWVRVFGEAIESAGLDIDKSSLYEMLFKKAFSGDADCDGVTACNYLSGEHITGIEKGTPVYTRSPEGKMNLSNFMRAQIYSAMSTVKIGMDILLEKEGIKGELFMAHGGLFKVKGVAQHMLSDALDTPVSVMETAGEGGAWGMALLALFMMDKNDMTLPEWLSKKIFASMETVTVNPCKEGVKGFSEYIKRFKGLLEAERKLEEVLC